MFARLFHPRQLIFTLLGILGVWLIYWDVADFMTKGLNTGIWDWTIIQNGFPSIIVGIIIILFLMWHAGIRVLR